MKTPFESTDHGQTQESTGPASGLSSSMAETWLEESDSEDTLPGKPSWTPSSQTLVDVPRPKPEPSVTLSDDGRQSSSEAPQASTLTVRGLPVQDDDDQANVTLLMEGQPAKFCPAQTSGGFPAPPSAQSQNRERPPLRDPAQVHPVTVPSRREGAHTQLGRMMGLVVALRFFLWGSAVGAIALVLFIESFRSQALLNSVTIPALLALYLLGTGQVLFLIRLATWSSRCLALGPVISVALLAIPGLAASATLVSMALGLGLWIYLGAFVRQASALGHGRAWSWYVRLRLFLLVILAFTGLMPTVAAPLFSLSGIVFVGATVAGWRIWLNELRVSIFELEKA